MLGPPRIAACLLLSTVPCACGTPHDFSLKDAKSLKVGEAKSSEYRALLGEPRAIRKRTNPDGTFEMAVYSKVIDEFSGDCIRLLVLEFKDGILNAVLSASSCSDDTTTANIQAAMNLKRDLGKVTRDGVIAVLGDPHGRARCPSLIPSYLRMCQQSDETSEVWSWLSAPRSAVFSHLPAAATLAFEQAQAVAPCAPVSRAANTDDVRRARTKVDRRAQRDVQRRDRSTYDPRRRTFALRRDPQAVTNGVPGSAITTPRTRPLRRE